MINGGQVISIDADGEIVYMVDKRSGIEGSFDTRCDIRSDGSVVEFSGNISRYGRRDNLFGYDWPETIRRINALLNLHSCPPFTSGKLFRFADHGWTWTGARVSRIDVTCNHACFSAEGMDVVLKALAGHHQGRQKGVLSIDGTTVAYGEGSKYVYGKVYAKYTELLAHRRRKSGAHVDEEVIDFCRDKGVLREEFTLKSRFLTQRQFCYLGQITHTNIRKLVGRHIHLRDVGVLGRRWYEWPELGDPDHFKTAPIAHKYKLPKKSFDLYKSSSLHIKRSYAMPPALILLIVMLLVLLAGGAYVYRSISSKMEPVALPAPVSSSGKIGPAATPAAAPAPSVPGTVDIDPADYLMAQTPRIYGQPESAPIYDQVRVVKALPFVAGCVQLAASCRCYTDQSTRVDMDDDQCRSWLQKPKFNPYLEPERTVRDVAERSDATKQEDAIPPPPVVASAT